MLEESPTQKYNAKNLEVTILTKSSALSINSTGQRNAHHKDKCIIRINSVQNTTNMKASEETSIQNTKKTKNKL